MVICFGYQSTPKKLITNPKISCPPFNIHKSRLGIAKWHYVKTCKTYNCFVFSTNMSSNSWENCFLERKLFFGWKNNFWTQCILNHFNKLFSTNCKGRWFLTIKKPKSSKNCFWCRSHFLKGFFVAKKLDMELKDTFSLFLKSCIPSFFKRLFTSSSI
jgi:hypothetical protein